MELTIDREYLLKTLTDLVRINSINPSLVPGGAGEGEVATYIAAALRSLGLAIAVHEAAPGRPSTVGILKGSGGGRSLMLNGHIDTVSVEGMAEPFSAEVRDGKLYGRGAYDMKGSIAACLTAVKALVEAGIPLRGDLLLAAVADEEYASIGTADVARRYQVDGAIVTEPTHMQLCLAHKGFIWLEVETFGRAAHGSRFEDGIDANMRMGRFLAELDKLEQEFRQRPPHPLVGPPSLHASLLKGGTELSAYAAHCQLGIEVRTIPGQTEAQVLGEIQAIIDRLSQADPTFKARAKAVLVRNPFAVSPAAELVRVIDQVATPLLGQPPTRIGQPFWADTALLAEAGIETVMIGPSGAGAHAEEEWIDLDSLAQFADLLVRAVVAYCQ